MPQKFQDFWVTGSRMFLKKDDDADGTKHPFVDLGVIDVVSPAVTPEEISLKDSDGGVKRIVDQRIIGIEESYEVKCSNLNYDNLALLFLSNAPKDLGQTQVEKDVTIRAFPGRLLKLQDTDGTLLYGIDAVGGVYTGTLNTYVLTDIIKSSKTLKLTGDQSAAAGLQPGKKIIVRKAGLTNIKNSRTYTVFSIAFSTTTNIVVVEEPEANESGIVGSLSGENSGTVYGMGASDDWEVAGEQNRGFLRIMSGGSISTEQDVKVIFTVAALSGNRLLNPQDLTGQIKGKAVLVWGRLGNAEQTAREFAVSVTPASAAFAVDDYSNFTLKFSVLTDPGSLVPAGRLIHFKGAVPDLS